MIKKVNAHNDADSTCTDTDTLTHQNVTNDIFVVERVCAFGRACAPPICINIYGDDGGGRSDDSSLRLYASRCGFRSTMTIPTLLRCCCRNTRTQARIHTNPHIHKHTQTQTHTHTHKHTHKHTHIHK